MAVEAHAAEIQWVLSTAIDAHFYRTMYPDVAAAGLTALDHYCLTGWREGRDATPWFSTEDYLALHADVESLGIEPLFHYLTVGRHEGRAIAPSRHSRAYLTYVNWAPEPWRPEHLPPLVERAVERVAPPEPAPAVEVIEAVGVVEVVEPVEVPEIVALEPVELEEPVTLEPEEVEEVLSHYDQDARIVERDFDPAFYLAAYPDVAAAGLDPLWHFTRTGWSEGRDPTRWFSIRDYLETYPDIANAGINPFVHYVAAGRAENRITRLDLGFRYPIIAGATPPAQRLAGTIAASEQLTVRGVDELALALKAAPAGLSDLHVTFSHDDYTATFGGMQLCLRRESAEVAAQGVDHLHIHPAKPWPTARADSQPGVVGVLLNGERLGVFAAADVIAAARKAVRGRPAGGRSFAIHSLLGHSAADTVALLKVFKLKAGFFWLHDFASLCAGFHLLRNDVQDCAAPPIESPACRICSYGPLRAAQIASHDDLFRQLDLTVVGPSATTLGFWQSRAPYAAKDAVVLPHAEMVDTGPALGTGSARRALRIAFLGMPAPLKGWPIFAGLAERHTDDRRYRFMHLGGMPDARSSIEFHEVIACEEKPDAMRVMLEKLEVDVAIVWPLCRETFSFTAYEAAAAGCAVVTWPDSGNVAAFVTESGQGLVLPDEAALDQAFVSGDVRALSRTRRKARASTLRYSAMTADLLEGKVA
jgi:hypothetical protein